jgi:hypothetical protein
MEDMMKGMANQAKDIVEKNMDPEELQKLKDETGENDSPSVNSSFGADPDDKDAKLDGVPRADPESPEAKKAEAAASKEMCVGFRKTFEEQQAKYSQAVFDSLAAYFETPETMEKLSIMLEKYIGMYIRSPKFGSSAGTVIDEAFRDVIKRALKKNFKQGANLKGLYTELDKYMGRHATGQRTRRAAGGGTRSKRKQKRKTVKRRS